MSKKFLKKIIAHSAQDLKVISALCSESKVKLSDIKFLKKNKRFLISLIRFDREVKKKEKITSIIKFDFIDSSKSRNIDQSNQDLTLELLAIDIFKHNYNYEITLLFRDNAFITLTSEIIDCSLEDLKKIND